MSLQPDQLCDRCRAFDIRALLQAAASAPAIPNTKHTQQAQSLVREGRARFFEQHRSLLALKASSDRCRLCHAIWTDFCRQRSQAELSDEALQHGVGSLPIYLGTLPWDTELDAIPHVVATQHGLPPHNIQRQLACFEACAAEKDLKTDNRPLLARLQSPSSADEDCLDLANTWLQTCRESHPGCDQTRGVSLKFPTRVLDTFTSDGKIEGAVVRLIDGDGRDEPYVALSYCWGGPQALVLTKKTEPQLRQGLADNDFAQTIHDAILVTRKLGLRYLWVDALCIVQDSDEDKAREIARMRDVYRGAVVTIEAASALKASDSFLKERLSSRPYCRLPWGLQTNAQEVYLRPICDISDNQLVASKLYTRGWVLQERLLSPRTLSFGSQQTSFECCEGYMDESGRSSASPRLIKAHLSKKTLQQIRQSQQGFARIRRRLLRMCRVPPHIHFPGSVWYTIDLVPGPGGAAATYYDYWRSVVEHFGERELTDATDRLPAVAGLAKELQNGTDDTYIAGHWHSEFVQSLNWRCADLFNYVGDYGPGKHQSAVPSNGYVHKWPDGIKSDSYIAPSWSWASCKGRIIFYDGTTQNDRTLIMTAKLLKYNVERSFDGDPFGAVRSAYIDISAPFLSIPDPQAPWEPTQSLSAIYPELHGLTRLGEHSAAEFHQHHKPHDGQEFALVQIVLDKSNIRTHVEDILFMLLIESCGDGTYRRVSRHSMSWARIQEQLQAEIAFSDGSAEHESYISSMKSNYQAIIEAAKVLAAAPWQQRTIRLV